MSLGKNTTTLRAKTESFLRRGLRSRRWAAAVLALGLGLNGVGQCLCAPQPDTACEQKGCCPTSEHHHHGVLGTGASVEAASAACCLSQAAGSAVAVPVDDRDALRHAPGVVTSIRVASDLTTTPATIGAAAWRSPSSSPPRTPVLRI